MRLSIDLPSGRTLTTDVDETLAARAQYLLGRLAAPAATLADRSTTDVALHWATVRLRDNGGHVVAEEPDYSRDPSRFVPSLSVTSRIFDAQDVVLDKVGVDGQPVAAHQYVRVSVEALASVSIVGYRHPDLEEPFTGWELVPAGLPLKQDPGGEYTVRELAAQRLVWIVGLVLPTGCSFRCVGNTLADAVSPAGQTYELLESVDL